MEFTLKKRGVGKAANKWIPWSFFFPEKTVFSVLLPKPGQAKKKTKPKSGWGGGEELSHYMKNPSSSLKENIPDTKSPSTTDAQLHIALQFHDCNLSSSLSA